jgi:hypothetical protein
MTKASSLSVYLKLNKMFQICASACHNSLNDLFHSWFAHKKFVEFFVRRVFGPTFSIKNVYLLTQKMTV